MNGGFSYDVAVVRDSGGRLLDGYSSITQLAFDRFAILAERLALVGDSLRAVAENIEGADADAAAYLDQQGRR